MRLDANSTLLLRYDRGELERHRYVHEWGTFGTTIEPLVRGETPALRDLYGRGYNVSGDSVSVSTEVATRGHLRKQPLR